MPWRREEFEVDGCQVGGRESTRGPALRTPMPCHGGRNSPSSLLVLATARPMMIRRKPKLRNRRVCLDSDSIPLPTAAAAGRYNKRQIDSYTLPPSPLFSASFAGRACGGGKFRLQLGWLAVCAQFSSMLPTVCPAQNPASSACGAAQFKGNPRLDSQWNKKLK